MRDLKWRRFPKGKPLIKQKTLPSLYRLRNGISGAIIVVVVTTNGRATRCQQRTLPSNAKGPKEAFSDFIYPPNERWAEVFRGSPKEGKANRQTDKYVD